MKGLMRMEDFSKMCPVELHIANFNQICLALFEQGL
jgi:hypothetical protein